MPESDPTNPLTPPTPPAEKDKSTQQLEVLARVIIDQMGAEAVCLFVRFTEKDSSYVVLFKPGFTCVEAFYVGMDAADAANDLLRKIVRIRVQPGKEEATQNGVEPDNPTIGERAGS